MALPRVVAIVGATATGKTALGEALADAIGGEVVCADSRQVFRELEIGTGKPSPAERGRRPHHLFDALELGGRASAGWYARAAADACAAVAARGRVPLLVGGSGLYVRALAQGMAAEPPHDPALRSRLRAEAASAGGAGLHRRLATCDPATAARVAPTDLQRIVRALEVYEASGRPLSWWHRHAHARPLAAEWRNFEIRRTSVALDERIATRTRAMLDSGLIEETRALLESGHEAALRTLAAIGYDEAMELLAGRLERADAEARITLRTRQLAKRQGTWFRHQLEAVRLDAGARTDDELVAAMRAGLD